MTDTPDIVERIRKRFPRPKHADDGLLANEAADEITRLRAELAQARQRIEGVGMPGVANP